MVESEGRTQIKNVYTISAPVSGRLLRIPLKAGDAVIAEKTVLARIDPPPSSYAGYTNYRRTSG